MRAASNAKAVEVVARMASAIAREVASERIVALVLDQTTRMFRASVTFLHRVDQERGELLLLGQRNLPPDLVEHLARLTIHDPSLSAHAARARRLLSIQSVDHLESTLAASREVLSRTGSASMLSVPLFARRRLVGVLSCAFPSGIHPTSEEVAAIQTIAGIVGLGLANACANEERARLEAALRASEQQFRTLVTRIPGAVYRHSHDANWSAIYFSNEIEKLTGYPPTDFVGNRVRSFASIIHPDDRQAVESAIGAALDRHEPFAVEYRIVHADGSVGWVSDRGHGVFSEQGRLLWVDGVILNITDWKHAEETVRASDERLRRLQDAISVGVVVHDRSGAIIHCNRAASEILGLTVEQIRGRTALDPRWRAIREDGSDFPGIEHPAMVTLRTGKPVRNVVMGVMHAATAARRWILINSTPVFDAVTGELQEVVATFVDITERKHADERLVAERRWLQAVIEHSPVGILLVESVQGQRIVANRRAAELFGQQWAPERGVEQYVTHVRHADGSPIPWDELASVRALRGEVVIRLEELLRRPDGVEVPISVSAGPIRDADGSILGSVVIFEDISAAKELERLREEWTSVVAHDLRQPVTVIAGYAGLLARQSDQLAEPLQRWVEHIAASAQQLSRMIADLLDASRIEARRLALERTVVDLHALIHAIVERTAEITAGHPVQIEIRGPLPAVSGDPGRLEQVLSNLLSNAAKYSYPNTEIRVEAERRDGLVEIAVCNRGEGIPPEELPKLFSRYHRTRQTVKQQVGGLGLGLYIARGLIEAQGGRIWAESIPGGITTFRFTVPIADPAKAA